ncbi:MAG: alpha/beta hydrolase [Cyanobacteria bacterium REEB67]|nr:alpha/beta hydrolase [Cyanobacteria bacterium REEB67]
MIKNLSLTLAATIALFVWGEQTFAADQVAPPYVTIPILYLTDREQEINTYGHRRRYPIQCEHHMYYGTASVTVHNRRKLLIDDHLKNLGWLGAEKKGKKQAPEDRIMVPANDRLAEVHVTRKERFDAAKEEFFDRIKKALDSNGSPELCVFVHGAADGFEDCLEDAATLAYYLQKPMVLYSWPSNPTIIDYFIDGANVEWSQQHFNMFCNDLLKLREEHPLEVIALAHSMGNRVVIRAMPHVYGTQLIKDWELMSPDIDADTTRHYTMGCTQAKARIRLYVSNKDKLLPFSQLLSGGYYRLGEAATPTRRRVNGADEYLERIDFTVVDKGLVGHTMPFELVSNMVHSDKPGEGFELEPEPVVKATGVEHFAGRGEEKSPTSKEADFCSKLVRVIKPPELEALKKAETTIEEKVEGNGGDVPKPHTL